MKAKTYKIYIALENIFTAAVVIGGMAFVIFMVMSVYGYIEYPNTLFTTDANYQPLEEAAPLLGKFIVFFLCVMLGCVGVAVFSYEVAMVICKTNKKERR